MNVRIASINNLLKILDLYKELNLDDDEFDLITAEEFWNKSELKN
jgi:hypothetical protein